MSFLVVLGVLFLILFIFPYVTKRRLGTLGLALGAGWVLSELWSKDVSGLVADAGVTMTAPPLESVVSVVLVLVPALLVLHRGPVTHAKWRRVIGAGLFALTALALLLPVLQTGLVIDGPGQGIYDFLAHNRATIVTVGFVAAVLDVFFTKSVKEPKPHDKH